MIQKLALGTAALGMAYAGLPKPGRREAVAVVRAALDAGMQLVDTAPGYGDAEEIVGEALRESGHVGCLLVSKVSCRLPDGTLPAGAALRRHMLSQLHGSLHRLGGDRLHAWLIHDDSSVVLESPAVWDALREAREAGLTRLVGASVYPDKLPFATLGECQVLQVPYSPLDTRAGKLSYPARCTVIVRSILMRGALAGNLWPFAAAARALGMEPGELALRFALAAPWADFALVGPRSVAELERCLEWAISATP